ncbi:hypothetical protein [Catellatospora chokoriensis]|uniref:Uncharacterized protein n=1 Tax=Catellatospora chokoriensis TaxID=310353 RepID=A0A8J3JWL6_9ACTN|nr:hypothetical protein [Catellatospora chokoriensis]GIF89819.1 hypothetical protein Cch02nite_32630 [Catellatospora chokoriensis]
MLRPASYLTDEDFFATLADAPRADGLKPGILAQPLSDEYTFTPAHTVHAVHAVHTSILAAICLREAAELPNHSIGSTRELRRLIAGLNLASAYLAQTAEALAEQAQRGLVDVDAQHADRLGICLALAGHGWQTAAHRLREAHLLLGNQQH